MNKKVTIITASFNSKKYIGKTIQSVLNQTYEDWEMIIIDDCSSDGSVEFIKTFILNDNRIKLISLDQNLGSGEARNRGVKASTGRYISFLDSDDYWSPEKLEKQVLFMEKEGLSLSYTQYYEIDFESENIVSLVQSPSVVDLKKILKNGYIGCLTAMYDTEKLGKRYMPKIRKRQDWALWIDILKDIDYAKGIQEPLAFYRVGNNSISKNKFKLIKHNFNIYRKQLGFSLIKSTFFMVNFLFHYFVFKGFKVKKNVANNMI